MSDIFISYKTEDIAEARFVKEHLEKEGFSVWMAPDSITGGASYAGEIPPAISACKVFVLILSDKAQKSKWVPRELDQAINEDKIIMPFMIEDCVLDNEFKFYLTNVQRYPAFENKQKALDKMIREIKKYLAPPKQEKKPEPPAPPKPKKVKKPKKNAKKNVLIALVIILAVIFGCVLMNVLSHVTIAGEKIEKSASSIYFYKKEITSEDMLKIADLELTSLSFDQCTIKGSNIGSMVDDITYSVTFSNCSLTKEQIESLRFKDDQLATFNMTGNEVFSDLSPLTNQKGRLMNLKISDTSVNDISAIKGFGKLSEIEANNCNISDISPLANCENLQTLKLNGNKIETLRPLENLTKLTRLEVSNNKLKNLDGIEKVIELTEIRASGNSIENIDGLSNTTLLRNVYLSNNKIGDISLLEKSAENLQRVYLENNAVTDITPLEKAVNITYLNVSGNEIADISAVKGMTALIGLGAAANKLEGETDLTGFNELRYLVLADNAITKLKTGFKAGNGSVLIMNNNPLAELDVPYADNYRGLLLAGCPLESFDTLYNAKGTLVFNYNEAIDMAKMNASGVTLIGCPLDKQVGVKEALSANVTFAESFETDISEYLPDDMLGN